MGFVCNVSVRLTPFKFDLETFRGVSLYCFVSESVTGLGVTAISYVVG